jgi:hypothetical protein
VQESANLIARPLAELGPCWPAPLTVAAALVDQGVEGQVTRELECPPTDAEVRERCEASFGGSRSRRVAICARAAYP